MRRLVSIFSAGALTATLFGLGAVGAYTNYGNGWEADPGQQHVFEASVEAPINADGSSVFKARGNGAIPIKFSLLEGTSPLVFESLQDGSISFSNVVYTPDSPMTVADITNLSAVYAFATGDCQAGSLRWTIGTASGPNIHVYFYEPNNPTDPVCTGVNNQSGVNLLTLGVNAEAQGEAVTAVYHDWAYILTNYGSLPVSWVGLIVDSGFAGDEVVNLTSATVNEQTFTPDEPTALAPVCASDEATITVKKLDSSASSSVTQDTSSVQQRDDDGIFRIVDCHYMYNLAVNSLSGAGTYKVSATIGDTTFDVAQFDLR